MIVSNDFILINGDYYVYTKRFKDKYIIMLLYVDDILIASNSKEYVSKIKGWLSSNFKMKDMGEPVDIIRVKISRGCS